MDSVLEWRWVGSLSTLPGVELPAWCVRSSLGQVVLSVEGRVMIPAAAILSVRQKGPVGIHEMESSHERYWWGVTLEVKASPPLQHTLQHTPLMRIPQ